MASIQFHTLFLKYKNKVTDFNFEKLFSSIWTGHDARQRTLKINDKWFSLSAYEIPNNSHGTTLFWIDKSLTANPYTGDLGTTDRKEVSGTLYQPATCLYESSSHTLAIYQPSGAPTISEITSYLNAFVSATLPDEDCSIISHNINLDLSIQNLSKKDVINNVSFSINLEKFNIGTKDSSKIAKFNDLGETLLKALQNVSTSMNNMSKDDETVLNLKLKNTKKTPLNFEYILFLQNLIETDNTLVTDAEVSIKKNGKSEKIRLSKRTMFTVNFDIDVAITGSAALFANLYEYYNDGKFKDAMKPKQLPNMMQITSKDYEFILEPEGVLSQEKFDEIKQKHRKSRTNSVELVS